MLGPNRFMTGGGVPVPRRVTLISCPSAVAGTRAIRSRTTALIPQKMLESISLLLGSGAERWRSPAAGSGSEARADAGGSQVQCFVRRRVEPQAGSARFFALMAGGPTI